MPYNEGVCLEKHKSVEERNVIVDKRLDNHSGRLDTVEQDCREYKTQINNLCKQVGDLVSTLKWLMALSIPSILTIIGLLVRKG